MGNNYFGAIGKKGGTIFRQSLFDFPCPVTLGKNTPSFGLHRFNQALRFVPPADEGYTMRGDKQRLLYKGRRRSHRFTILGDTAFEYDCILEKPPDSNIITLLIDGAENYNFFRQPDFIKSPLLRGSYAVYKKETLLGEGTGKLCHIHRPEIIDSRGRRCWGGLAVVGNELRITIPEKWLGEAAYPVIVDPVVGTTTIGAFYGEYEDYFEPYFDEEEGVDVECYRWPYILDESVVTNKYIVPEDMYGKATAYVYLLEHKEYSWTSNGYNYNDTICPCLYSDNNNVPRQRLSANELYFNDVVNNTNKPDGWRSATFTTKQVINAGTNVWFGVLCGSFEPRFDYGAKCFSNYDETFRFYENTPPPDICPLYYYWGSNEYITIDMKISMYFNYTAMQHYKRTITQGVKLTDKRKLKADYKRNLKQTVKVNFVIQRMGTFFRKCVQTLYNTMKVSRFPAFVRTLTEFIKTTTVNTENRSLSRKCIDNIKAHSEQKRIHKAFRKVQSGFQGIDRNSFSIIFLRSLLDTIMPSDKMRHWGSFIRGLFINAGSKAETSHKANYHRFQKDKVQAQGLVFRGLLLFVRIITKVFIRDYILGRFLKARQDLTLKSAVCREITLDSKLS